MWSYLSYVLGKSLQSSRKWCKSILLELCMHEEPSHLCTDFMSFWPMLWLSPDVEIRSAADFKARDGNRQSSHEKSYGVSKPSLLIEQKADREQICADLALLAPLSPPSLAIEFLLRLWLPARASRLEQYQAGAEAFLPRKRRARNSRPINYSYEITLYPLRSLKWKVKMPWNGLNPKTVQLRFWLQLGKGQVEMLNADWELAFVSHPHSSPEFDFFFV